MTKSLDSWWLDAKLGLRMLIKYPGLALIGGLGIAVGVAIAAGGFSAIHGSFLVKSLPLDEGDRLVSIELWDAAASKPERRIQRDFQSWREGLKTVRELSAFRTIAANLTAPGGKPESINVALMSASGFSVARVRPLMGRYLVEDDEREGAPAVVVIGETVWRTRFGGDPAIVGRTIQLGGTPHAIAGVMPASFAFPVNHRFWAPLRLPAPPPQPLTGVELMVFGRLAPRASLEQAQAELATLGHRAAAASPKVYERLSPQAMPYANPFMGIHGVWDARGLEMMNGIVLMLVVLVCLNVAILVYTRTAMREAEISVRTALGASRGRIVVQLFIEALALSAVGALAGVGLAALALHQVGLALRTMSNELPFWISFQLSASAVLYAGALSVLAAAIISIVPALQATRRGIQSGARVTGAGGRDMRLGGTWTALVVAQVGFAVTLLPAAVFTTWNHVRAELTDPGFAAAEFLTAQLDMDGEQNRRFADRQTELTRRLEGEPQVAATTFATSVPGDERQAIMESLRDASTGGTSSHEVQVNRVDVNFFRVLGTPILAGRDFVTADVASPAAAGSVVVNQSFALRIFGGDALGRRIRYAGGGSAPRQDEPGPWYEITGIVKDFPAGLSPGMLDSPLKLYHAATPGQVQPVNLVMRIRGGAPSSFTQRLREIALAVDPALNVRNLISLDEVLRKEPWIRRLETAVLGSASLVVLLLSSAGIYALMSVTVSQRRKEIGIRLALGADRTRIVASIFSRAFAQLAAGAALGLVAAAMLEKASGDELMRGNATVVLPGVALFMIAVGVLAALGPTRRCLGIEPTEALREQ